MGGGLDGFVIAGKQGLMRGPKCATKARCEDGADISSDGPRPAAALVPGVSQRSFYFLAPDESKGCAMAFFELLLPEVKYSASTTTTTTSEAGEGGNDPS